jgi:uncharacterized protein YndB with AHSA1/START domain
MTARTKRAASAIADTAAGIVLARVEIAAPPDRVFRAISSEEVTKWWGSPEMYRTTKYSVDLRPGGAWRSDGVGADGSAFHVAGEVIEVDPPHKLVQTWNPSWETGPATTITWRLEASPIGTVLTVRHTGFVDPRMCTHHADGWTRIFNWLHEFAVPSAGEQYFVCRLIAPRPTFMQDMTAEERDIMIAHAAYWTSRLAAGEVIVFGPVADPAGPWGLGVVKATDEAAVREFEAKDPAISAARGFRYEVLPMVRALY